MNGKRAKWIAKLVATQNPVLLVMIRNKYGKLTERMTPRQIYQAAKKMWYSGELKGVRGWPSLKELKNMNMKNG